MTVKDLKSYQILNEKHVKELNSDGILLEHKKTGARVFLLSNDDENKVFCIGFRTPPSDSTGVPHIMEHSVLCGSAKFPVKDPFVELVKGSLNTFLNAMTYPDKTVYPVASCNDKDFQNLMDVYMDAVLHPNIYKEEKIFRQEGWHYEMESADSPITVNGVVYNEMKGAFSSPEGVLDRYTQNTLYPDTCYTHESGGAPEVIPELTYENFLNFHRKFYHPSNSFIYLYGNMDMAEKLEWLDREYLSKYDRQPADSEISHRQGLLGGAEKDPDPRAGRAPPGPVVPGRGVQRPLARHRDRAHPSGTVQCGLRCRAAGADHLERREHGRLLLWRREKAALYAGRPSHGQRAEL